MAFSIIVSEVFPKRYCKLMYIAEHKREAKMTKVHPSDMILHKKDIGKNKEAINISIKSSLEISILTNVYLYTKNNITRRTIVSAIIDAIDAPIAPILGIRHRFNTKLVTAPTIIA